MSHTYISSLSISHPLLNPIRIDDLSPGLNIIFGSNEAGKSRTKDFIEWLMYANSSEYEGGTKAARKTAFSKIENGLRGHYDLITGEQKLSVNIRFDNGEAITTCDSPSYTPNDISHVLTDGVRHNNFRHIFSLSLDELNAIQSNKLMAEDQLAEEFLSASQTISGVSYTKFVNSLKEQRDKYFSESSNAKKPIINKLLKEIRDLDKEIRLLRTADSSFEEVKETIENKNREVDAIKATITGLLSQLNQNKEIQKNRALYEEYMRLTSLPKVSIHPTITSKCGEIDIIETRCEELIPAEKELIQISQEIEVLSKKEYEQAALLKLTLDPSQLNDYVRSSEFISISKQHENRTREIQTELSRLQEDNHKYSQEISLTMKLAEQLSSPPEPLPVNNMNNSFFEPTHIDAQEQEDKKKVFLAIGAFMGLCLIALGTLISFLPITAIGALLTGITGTLLYTQIKKKEPVTTPQEDEMQTKYDSSQDTLSQYQLKIEHFQEQIENIVERQKECTRQLSIENKNFEEALLKAGLPFDTSHELLDSYLAEYSFYIERKNALELKKDQANNLRHQITGVLEKIEALRPAAVGTNLELTSSIATISEALTWISSLHQFALEQKELEEEAYDRESKIQQLDKVLSQSFSSIDNASQIFSSTSAEQIDRDIKSLAEEISTNELLISKITKELGVLEDQLKSDKYSIDLTEALIKRKRLQEQLLIAHNEYFNLCHASNIAETAAQYFLRENQPAVLDKASELFRRATNNKWSRVEIGFADSNKTPVPVINVFNELTSEVISATQLSRGAQEQLFLCLRLAVMTTYVKGKQIPVLFDDIAVNSDRNRFEALAPLLEEIASNRQIFYFTCHETTRDILLSRANGKVFEI